LSAATLDPGRDDQELGRGPAATGDSDDVMQRGTIRASDDGDAGRVSRERTLAGRGEQALLVERGFHPLQGALLIADARRGQQPVDDELELALRLVERGTPLGEDLGTVGRGTPRPLGVGAPHGAPRLRGRVAEREVPVAAPMDPALDHLAADPHGAQASFEDRPDRRREIADREDLVGRTHGHRAHATACSNA
jgi:hypothetical protein